MSPLQRTTRMGRETLKCKKQIGKCQLHNGRAERGLMCGKPMG